MLTRNRGIGRTHSGSSGRSPPIRPPGDRAGALHYRQALALADELGMRPLVAHCHLGLGMLYAKTGQPEQARAELSTAIALYRAMGADVLAAAGGGGAGASGGAVVDYNALLPAVLALLRQEPSEQCGVEHRLSAGEGGFRSAFPYNQRYPNNTSTAMRQPGTAGSASAIVPLRKITGFSGSLAL